MGKSWDILKIWNVENGPKETMHFFFGNIKKPFFPFGTLQKMVTKLGPIKKLKCRERSRKTWHFFVVVEDIQKPQHFWENLLVTKFRTAKGRG